MTNILTNILQTFYRQSRPVKPTDMMSGMEDEFAEKFGVKRNYPHDILFAAGYDDQTEPTDLSVRAWNRFMIGRPFMVEDIVGKIDTSPAGSNVTIDIRANGSTIFSSLPYFNTSGVFNKGTFLPNLNIPAQAAIDLYVTTVGVTTPGAGLRLTLMGRTV